MRYAFSYQKERKLTINGHQRNLVSVGTFVLFYTDLAKYYRDVGDERSAARYHAHILKTIHKQLNHCSPDCDYFSISVAYENIEDGVQAFKFRELAHKYQLHSLKRMEEAKLIIDLYNDYSTESLGNNTDKANELSSVIIEKIYQILMDQSSYPKDLDVFYDAAEFFIANKLEEHAVHLQHKIQKAVEVEKCAVSISHNCLNQHVQQAWRRKCYHLVIGLGEKLFDNVQDKNPKLAMNAASLVGQSYYQIGNYTSSQIWLKRALYLLNKSYNSDLSKERLTLCLYLVWSGEVFNVFHYGYIIKHIGLAIAYGPGVIYQSWENE